MQEDELRPRLISRFIIGGVNTEGVNFQAGVGCIHGEGGCECVYGRGESPEAV